MSTSFPAPADVLLAVADGVSRLAAGGLDERGREAQLDRLAALYAEHTDVRHPFAPLGDTPLRTRAELRAHFAASSGRTAGAERFTVADATVHRTADPEVAILELTYRGTVGGRPFAVPCVFVARVRAGCIVESRDYADHLGFARAFGRLPELAARLSAAPGG